MTLPESTDQVAQAFLAHPGVSEAVVTHEEADGAPRLCAWVVPVDEGVASLGASGVVESWSAVFDDTYGQAVEDEDDPAVSIAGWTDSFSGQPIPAAQMREWVTHTVERILELDPRRVLEIGAGSGLLMEPLVRSGRLAAYVATDQSRQSQTLLTRLCERLADEAPTAVTEVRLAPADQPPSDETGWDTVIVNSVAQYFPSTMYLQTMLQRVLPSVAPGGHIFLGDLRNQALVEVFACLKHQLRDRGDDSGPAVLDQLERELAADPELSIDPDHLVAIVAELPGVTAVEIAPRRGESPNEMTLFRYDAIVHVGCPQPDPEPAWQDGAAETRQRLEHRLATQTGAFGLANVANARLREGQDAQRQLGFRAEGLPAGVEGLDPDAVLRLAERYGWRARIRLTPHASAGQIDVVFDRAGADPQHYRSAPPTPWSPQGTDPAVHAVLAPLVAREWSRELLAFVATVLPADTVPQTVVFTSRLPPVRAGQPDLTSTQLRRLRRDEAASRRDEPSPAPAPELDRLEARVHLAWAEVLRHADFGPDDDFFVLGGHSMASLKVMRRIGVDVGARLSVRLLFENPTVRQLSDAIRAQGLHLR